MTLRHFVLALTLLASWPALAEQPLTNDDILTMVRAGLSADVIVAKITSSPGAFTTSTEALVQLAAAKVPQPVIAAMIAKGSAPPAAREQQPAAPLARTILSGVEYWAGHEGYRGDLVVDERGLTFCCAQDLQVHNAYFRCTKSFQIPLGTITAAYVMTDPGKMPGVHLVDVANQGYYFVTDNLGREQRDQILTTFPAAMAGLFARKPSITHEEHSWKEQQTILRRYTPATVTGNTVCNQDYDLMPWGSR